MAVVIGMSRRVDELVHYQQGSHVYHNAVRELRNGFVPAGVPMCGRVSVDGVLRLFSLAVAAGEDYLPCRVVYEYG